MVFNTSLKSNADFNNNLFEKNGTNISLFLAGTKSTSSKTGCDKMNSQNSHDHAGHDHDHDKDGNSATTSRASPLLFGIFALFYVL